MKAIGWILVIAGFGCPIILLLTLGNFVSKSADGTVFSQGGAFKLLLTFMVYVVPGLFIGGSGAILVVVGSKRRKSQKEERGEGTKKCPQCAEEVNAEAKICRFCRYEFQQKEGYHPKEPMIGPPRKDPGKLTLEEGVSHEEKAFYGQLTDVKILEDKLELLKMKYAKLSREIRISNNESEKAKLRLEQGHISAEMERCRLGISRKR
jgi:hypothetical protein